MSLPSHHNRHQPSSLIIPITAGSAALLIIVLLVLLCCCLSRKSRRPCQTYQGCSLPLILLQLCRAIDYFSPASKLGQGGFGSVYSGQLLGSGQLVAVKLMDSGSLQGKREFQNKLALTAPSDLVLTLGYSFDRHQCLVLVYEFMPNRSLQDALLDCLSSELMPWNVAWGLLFFHCDYDPPIIHGDIKPSNVSSTSAFLPKSFTHPEHNKQVHGA